MHLKSYKRTLLGLSRRVIGVVLGAFLVAIESQRRVRNQLANP